jgi:hypothetical protein
MIVCSTHEDRLLLITCKSLALAESARNWIGATLLPSELEAELRAMASWSGVQSCLE